MRALPSHLWTLQKEIEGYIRSYGLDFFDVVFELVSYKEINEIAAYGGFPNRYPHWRFGMEFERLSKASTYGLHKIYELVINNNPCYAYLLKGSSIVEQKMVIAHVLAHSDFFKNNFYFSKTNRQMIDEVANHGARIRKYIERYGIREVEEFIDICHSIENLLDPHLPFMSQGREEEEEQEEILEPAKFKAKPYMEKFINPEEYIEQQRKKLEEKRRKKKGKIPQEPQRDVMLFLMNYAPLERWQRDILSIIREEAYYFVPQKQTKIMNEGWATYWHSKIMTEHALKASEIIDYADLHSNTVASSGLNINPYKIGMELFRDIESRWDKGQFGKEWEECDDLAYKKSWNRRLGLGRKKILEVRTLHNDITFIEEFFTLEFCQKYNLFTFGFNPRQERWEIQSRKFKDIKEKLLLQLTNLGEPFIYIEDANFENRSELLMRHDHQGIDLKLDYAWDTLANIFKIWKRPVNLLTKIDNKPTILKYDGKERQKKRIK
jgi:stage V sporulation protein R